MNRTWNLLLWLLGSAGLAAIGATGARAALIVGSATGVIAESAETDAAGAQVFGLDGPALLGQAFRIDFSYDTDLAPADTNPAAGRGQYTSTDPANDWLDLSLTVNGHTEVLPGDNRRADVLDGSPEDSFQLALELFVPLPDGNGQQREFLDFVVSMPDDVLTSEDLPTAFASDQITRVFNSAAFRINDFELDPNTGEVLSSRFVSFNLDIQEISASAVPEPATSLLLALGLLGLASRGLAPATAIFSTRSARARARSGARRSAP